MTFQKVVDVLKNKVDVLKNKYDSTIKLQDPKLGFILRNDLKNIQEIKKELKKINEELSKNNSIDIFRIYQREFEKYFRDFKEIQKKYIHLKAVTELEKQYYEQNKEAIKQVIQALNSVEVTSDNLKKVIINKCNHYKISLEPVESVEKVTTLPIHQATKEKLEVFDKVSKAPKVDLLKELKVMNQQIDEIHKNLLQMENKTDNQEIDLYALKDKINDLKKRYNKYQSSFKNMRHHPRFEEIDTNRLLFSSQSLEIIMEMCLKQIAKIKPKEAINNDVPVSKILLNYQKEVKEKEKYVVTEKERGLISSSLNEDLKHCNEELAKIRNFVNRANPKLRKRAFLNGVSSFIKNMVKLSFSMFPVVLFKNRQIGTLTSCMLVNNRIRIARKIISDEKKEMIYMDYNKIENQIATKVNCYVTIKNILDNSLDQLNKLQMEVESKFKFEKDDKLVIEIQNGLSSMKGQLETVKQQINTSYLEEKENEKRRKRK